MKNILTPSSDSYRMRRLSTRHCEIVAIATTKQPPLTKHKTLPQRWEIASLSFAMTVLLVILGSFSAFAQTPMGINYQGVARDPAGQPITNKPISVEIDIFDSTVSGSTLLFAEKHSVTTSSMGLLPSSLGGAQPPKALLAALIGAAAKNG